MPVQGLVRLRRHQLTRQSSPGNTVPATRAYPFQGVPSVELSWTDPEIDAGSRDPVAAPYRGAPDLTFPVTIPSLGYNTLTAILCGFFGGQEVPTGGGTAKTWTHEPESTTIDEPDLFTYEFGDDVVTDWYQFGDGIVTEFEITGPPGLGVLSASATWRLGSVASTGSTDSPVDGTVPTPGLEIDPDEVLLYLKDMGIYIADTVAGLGAGQVMDALHGFTFGGTQEVDDKRYANGDQSFDIDAYGLGAREMHLQATWAKTDDTVGVGSESDHWMSDQAVTRYVRLVFVSTVLAQAPSTFYGWTLTAPIRYYTREDSEEGQNTTVILDGHLFFDPDDLDGVLTSVLVNTLTEADLGTVAS
jgi:hypothetical protein